MEVELFGTEANGEDGRKVGALEEAHGGTLYIDEIADMPLDTQSKILRVLVEQQFTRVGGNTKVKVDVRVLSSTAQDLENLIKIGSLLLYQFMCRHYLNDVKMYQNLFPPSWTKSRVNQASAIVALAMTQWLYYKRITGQAIFANCAIILNG